MKQIPNLMTVRQFADKHQAFPQGALRNLMFLATTPKLPAKVTKRNGLAVALVKIGKKVMIDEAKFFEWVAEQQKENENVNGDV